MQLVKQAHEFEYRDPHGVDQLARADVWTDRRGERAVLVLWGMDAGTRDERLTLLENARRARLMLAGSLLPFTVPRARLEVLVMRPDRDQADPDEPAPDELAPAKPRALLLP